MNKDLLMNHLSVSLKGNHRRQQSASGRPSEMSHACTLDVDHVLDANYLI